MRIILVLAVLFAVGCGGRSTPVPPPTQPPVVKFPDCYINGHERFPEMKVHTDSRGRAFCYDDTEAQADPSLLPLRWDRAGEQIKAIRPGVDLDNPYPLNSTVFKFMPSDNMGQHEGVNYPFWKLNRVPGMPQRDDLLTVGLTTVDTWPFVIYALASGYQDREPLSVVRHESLHQRWFGFFPEESCPDATYVRVFEMTEHGGNCDPWAIPTPGVTQ